MGGWSSDAYLRYIHVYILVYCTIYLLVVNRFSGKTFQTFHYEQSVLQVPLPAVNIFPAPDKTTALHSVSAAILLKHVTISLKIKQEVLNMARCTDNLLAYY